MRARLSCLAVLLLSAPAALAAPPATPKRPVTDTVQGVAVRDDYRWLEDPAAAKAWTDAQDAHARRFLAALPELPVLRERIAAIQKRRSVRYAPFAWRAGRLFALRIDPALQQPQVVALASPDVLAGETVVLDPNRLDKKGTTAVDWAVPSPDGTLLAASISSGGSESGDLHVFEVATGKEVEPPLPRVQGGTAGGSLAWTADGKGFLYTRYPRPGERAEADLGFYQQVWSHLLGRPHAEDKAELTDLPRIAEVILSGDRDGDALLADVLNGDGGEHAYYVKQGGRWTQVTRFEDRAVDGALGAGALWLVSRKQSPNGEVLKVPLATPSLQAAARVVPPGTGALESVVATPARLYVQEILGGPQRLRVFEHSGKELAAVPTPAVASVGAPLRLDGEAVIFSAMTRLDPSAWYRYDAASGAVSATALRQTAPVDFSPYESVREECRSRDGTMVPLAVLRRKGLALDGKNPTLLEGYGGFGISLSPSYDPTAIAFLEQGGVIAVASLRGGGEYGEAWHEAGKLTRKQNVFDDFLACAEHLVAAGYTRPDRLAIEGGSNGGLLMGAAVTQKPHLFRAVVSHVGIYDMLRVELSPNGAFNVTEYGSVKDKAQFDALLGYSPYHHVLDGVAYPSLFLLQGENDPRVEPMQSKKMTARLQAATSSGRPVILRIQRDGGHGIGAPRDERIEIAASSYAFVLHELGLKVKRVVDVPPRR